MAGYFVSNCVLRKMVIVVCFGVTGAGFAVAQPSYTAVDLGTLQNGEANSWAWNVNELGEVVGFADAPNKRSIHAFLYQDGVMRDLLTLGGTYSWAYGINNSTEITGYSFVNNLTLHGFIWREGVMNDIGSPPYGRGTFSRGNDINEAGVITGVSHSSRSGMVVPYTAFLYDHGGWMELPSFGGSNGYGNGINDHNDVVGSAEYAEPGSGGLHGALWSDGLIVDLGSLGSDKNSVAQDINNSGQIVGLSLDSESQSRAFLWESGSIRDLGDFGGGQSWAYGINDRGQIVGSAEDGDGVKRGMLIDADGVKYDLNDLVQPGLDVIFHGSHCINEVGQIVSSAELPDGTRHAYLLTPDAMPVMGSPVPGNAGGINTITVTNVQAGNRVVVVYGLESRNVLVPFCGLYGSISNPVILRSSVADDSGVVSIDYFVPEQASGMTIYFQGLDVNQCEVSNLVRHVF